MLGAPFTGCQVQLFLKDTNRVNEAMETGDSIFAWVAGIAIFANLTIGGIAGFSIHRRLKTQELKNSTLATVSHELKTPLASMRVLLDTLLKAATWTIRSFTNTSNLRQTRTFA